MMKWMTENVPSQERILVSAGDSGQYVTAVTQRQTFSIYSGLIKNYTDLMTLLTSNASDLRAVPLMIQYNVSFICIGSTATTFLLQIAYYRHFNATQFLSTPYFTLAKEIGDACLFLFNAQAAVTAYKNYLRQLRAHISPPYPILRKERNYKVTIELCIYYLSIFFNAELLAKILVTTNILGEPIKNVGNIVMVNQQF